MIIGLIACLVCWHTLQAKVGREFVASDIRESMQKGDKLAILMVHFGSAYPEARESLERMNDQVRQAFPQVEVRQAYSARSIVNRVRVRESGSNIRQML